MKDEQKRAVDLKLYHCPKKIHPTPTTARDARAVP
jgi:hypothetical protein